MPTIEERLARAWLGYCLAWAEWCERRYSDPMGRCHDAAIDGLLKAIRTNRRSDGTMSIEHLRHWLRSEGRNKTAKFRRRARLLRRVPMGDRAGWTPEPWQLAID